ncbi:hypothetical protein [Kineococcus sp. SYSU DK004]|uniref:hypothetical protein n=1 Tax=Kineococcus sp. SYSU DK004 TaxID=3383125 RepID=UPI003D7E3A84
MHAGGVVRRVARRGGAGPGSAPPRLAAPPAPTGAPALLAPLPAQRPAASCRRRDALTAAVIVVLVAVLVRAGAGEPWAVGGLWGVFVAATGLAAHRWQEHGRPRGR